MSNGSYRVGFDSIARKQFRRLDTTVRRKITEALRRLAIDPRMANPNVTPMEGADLTYRLRVGGYRVVYEIYDDELLILVVGTGSRGQIYKKRR